MEIAEVTQTKTIPREYTVLVQNKKSLGHDECCNGRGCSSPRPKYYKYIQPEVPKSFAPVRRYVKPTNRIEDRTTYKLSFWDGPRTFVHPIVPKSNLKIEKGSFNDETTNRLSYLGNWCVKPEEPILPCSRQWLGSGPLQSVTTQKCDFTWKNIDPIKPIKARHNLYQPRGAMENKTSYRLSYFDGTCPKRVQPIKPIGQYVKLNGPIDERTTYKLSYWSNKVPLKETYPWAKRPKYRKPEAKIEDNTTYKLSYWPHCAKARKPIIRQAEKNLINAGPCFEDKTTYKLSFFNCKADRQQPIRPSENLSLSTCPLTNDTVNKLSYLGNWCVKPENPIKPCSRNWLGQGDMQKDTTQKCDFSWKFQVPGPQIVPPSNLKCSSKPLDSITTQKLSFMPNDLRHIVPAKSFAPNRKYEKSTIPLESDTVQRLSYQPVEHIDKVEITWKKRGSFERPTGTLEDNTTYNLSYIPPGTLIPVS